MHYNSAFICPKDFNTRSSFTILFKIREQSYNHLCGSLLNDFFNIAILAAPNYDVHSKKKDGQSI